MSRGAQASWSPPEDRADPVDILIESGRRRIARLLPIRYDRMKQSPFTFLRGAAAIMAADLATTPTTGLRVQAGGDCHLGNMGAFASPEGLPIFDLNDFDETLPAPFEWDLKRLAASFAVDARSRGMADKAARSLARSACAAYRMHVALLAEMSPIDAWRSHIPLQDALDEITNERVRARETRRLAAIAEAGRAGYPKLIERHRGKWRIRSQPPLILPIDEGDEFHGAALRTAFEAYVAALPVDRRVLLSRYRLSDLAFKVVGVGSVGTFCALALLTTAEGQPLLLQIKEAQRSVLAPFAGASTFANQGERVVTGQRIMQAMPDPFLGWTQDTADDLQCYVRQLKDSRLAGVGTSMEDAALSSYALLCGRALARAHARSADPAPLAGYMGKGETFDSAIGDFAMAYADQTDRDFHAFVAAIRSGRIAAHTP